MHCVQEINDRGVRPPSEKGNRVIDRQDPGQMLERAVTNERLQKNLLAVEAVATTTRKAAPRPLINNVPELAPYYDTEVAVLSEFRNHRLTPTTLKLAAANFPSIRVATV